MIIRTLIIAFCYIFLSACANPSLTETVHINKDTQCSPLFLKKGQNLTVTLPVTRASGYAWHIKTDATPILQLSHSHIKTIDESELNKDEAIWYFKAIQTGRSTLTLDYQLEWDTNVSKGQHFSCEIVVNNP